jgi:hypothetical protein
MLTIRGLMAGAILALSLSVHGEVRPFAPASDTDLHAGYCIGTEEQQAAWEGNAVAANTPPSDFHRRMAANAQTRLQRLHHYLDHRLTFVWKTDIDAASKQGLADARFIVNDPKVHACTDKCRHLPVNVGVAVKQCIASCDERLTHIWTCKDLSWLP